MTRIHLMLAAVAIAGLLGIPGTPAPAEAIDSASSPERSGPRVSTVGVGSHHLDARSIERLRDLGVQHVRTTLYWATWEQNPAYRRDFARDLRAAVAAELEPLILVHGQPSGGFAERRQVYAEYARFMQARVAEFPEVRYWQLWNEMDLGFTDIFGANRPEVSLRQRGRNYAQMLEEAYPAIKRANPRALVITGGIASGIDEGFLHGMYEGKARFDVLAIHSYGFPLWFAFRDRGRLAREVMRQHGDSRPLWNTEFGMESAVVAPGWPARPVDVDGYHLDAWKDCVEGNGRESIYDRVYGHVLFQDGDLSYDLVRKDGSPRPAYLWLKSWLKG